jgi:hypothetical protein
MVHPRQLRGSSYTIKLPVAWDKMRCNQNRKRDSKKNRRIYLRDPVLRDKTSFETLVELIINTKCLMLI